MNRLYFMARDVKTAKRVVDELLLDRIEEKHIHVIAKEGTPLEDLPEASVLQKSDFAPAIEKGLAFGGAAGIIAGLVALAVPGGLILGGGATLLATTVAGASVGAFGASLTALDVPSSRLREFEEDLKAGRILVIVDVPRDRVEATRTTVTSHHGDVLDRGKATTIPRFP